MITRGALLTLLAFAAVAVPARSARGQLEVRRGIIAGRVLSPTDSSPIVGAVVTIVGRYDQQVTDDRGEFRFNGIHPGRYEVRVRRLGMEQLVKFVTVGPGEAVMTDWQMHLLPQMLAEVRVHGQMVRVSPEFQEPYRRAAIGFGDFFLKSDIDRRNPVDTKTLLESLPGVRASNRGLKFERCGTEVLAPTPNVGGQGAAIGAADQQQETGLTSDMIEQPGIQVYVDGHRMTNLNTTVDDVLASVEPSDIEIMEVYRGVSRIPGEYLRNACAVIAIWTKRG
jgi:Carboxypeptidase regulatory-like domain/TonB-dependent Receptor Plug Domain